MKKFLLHIIHNSLSSSSSGEWSQMSFNSKHPKATLCTNVFVFFHIPFHDSGHSVFLVYINECIYSTSKVMGWYLSFTNW